MIHRVMRRVACALVGLFCATALGCGSRPAPNLDDYSWGTAALVRELEPLFTSQQELDPGRRSNPSAASALQELAGRWAAATASGRQAFLRIVDFKRFGASRAELTLEVRLQGVSRTDASERIAGLSRFLLRLERRTEENSNDKRWQLAYSETIGRRTALMRARPHLVEAARASGIDVRHESFDPVEETNISIPATHHHPGILLVDVDADGALDIIVPNRRPRLFLNDGTGHFVDRTAGSGLDLLPEGEASGGVAADVDGDGLPDLFLTYHYSPCRLLRNEGGGHFRDMTDAWGLAGLSGPYTSTVFFDADGDGRVDLYVICYGDARQTGPAYNGFNGMPNRFFRNVAAGTSGEPRFVDESSISGLANTGWGFAASACDFDDDGDDDIYVANDFGKNALFENRSTPGHPHFVNIAKASGTEDEGYGMGATWGDYDGDGRWDLHVTDYWTPYRWILRDRRWPMPPMLGAALVRPMMARIMTRRSRGDGLFRNMGGKRFERTSDAAGVADGGWAWGTEFVDLDGKGREDLLVVNGMWDATTGVDDEIAFWNGMARDGVSFHDGVFGGIDFGGNGMASRTPKKLFWNRGDGTFEERAYVEGFDTLENTRGLAYGDLDGDGAPEIVLSCFRGPVLLYKNGWGAAAGGRIRLRLGMRSGFNREALGAVARLWSGGRIQIREVRAGSSFLSQSSRELLFGIGAQKRAERIEVRWPDGKRETLTDVPAGSRVIWFQGDVPKILTGDNAKGRIPT